MFLTAYNLPHYLMASGLITRESVVDGDLSIVEAGRRNRNFKVLRKRTPGLFVKQIKTTEQQAIWTIEREAAFYRAIESGPAFAALRPLVPRFIHYDPQRYALTLTLTDFAESVQERHVREGRYDERLASVLGNSLGVIHAHGPAVAGDPSLATVFPRQAPWPLTLDQTGFNSLAGLGPIGPALMAGISRRPSLQPSLAALRAEWQFDSLLHNDMKWDNCLVRMPLPGQPEQQTSITIVDWELADLGDSAWDVGAILKEYVMAILFNTYSRENAIAQNYSPPAALHPDALRPSVRAFWESYCVARGLSGYAAGTLLHKSIRMAASRLLVGILEYFSSAQQFGPLGEGMLDIAVGVLHQPWAAIGQMFGEQAMGAAA